MDPRDRSGSTPLSVTAEEAGRTGAAAALLAAGADVRAKNAAGEAPMYIASLRGHAAVVQVLLQFHERHGISWTVRPHHHTACFFLQANVCITAHYALL